MRFPIPRFNGSFFMGWHSRVLLVVGWTMLVSAPAARAEDQPGRMTTMRVPENGLQPQVAVDDKGVVHLVYFTGHADGGDLSYVQAPAEKLATAADFSKPLHVNSQPRSAVAVGNIRGAHLALGKNGRAHVAWMGSRYAEPRTSNDTAPMLYTRLSNDGVSFEPQRNVIQEHPGLDGGGSLAADNGGNVYITWHAPPPGKKGEFNRQVWVTRSSDEGRTFAPDVAAWSEPVGACGCCGLRAMADSHGRLYILFRSATESVHRDMYLLSAAASADQSLQFEGFKVHPWQVDYCVMSTAALAEGPQGMLAAWETEEQIYFGRVSDDGKSLAPIAAPGKSQRRKHPALRL